MTLPPSLPTSRLVQTLHFVRDPFPMIDQCRTELGDIFRIRLLGMGDMVFLNAPEHLKQMFTAPPEVLYAGEANAILFGPIAGEQTMFTLDEGQHARQRKLLQPPLHGERMQVYADAMRSVTEEQMRTWPKDRPFSIHHEMQEIALHIILRAIFGLEHGARAKELRELLGRLADQGLASRLLMLPALQLDLGRYSPWGRIMHVRRETDRALYAEIASRRATSSELNARQDILSLLLLVRSEDGQPLSDVALRDELVTMLLAGHETTATSLAWVFERVLSLPEVHDKLAAEIQAVVGDGPLGRDHLPKLEYTDAVIKEALRLRPISPYVAPRVVKKEFEVGGFKLPPGMTVVCCSYLAHRRPDTYAQPDEFRPERFLGTKPDPFEWVMFGGGVRRCIGAAFASFEMKIVLATIVQRLELRLPAPCGRSRRGPFTAPANGLPVEIARIRPVKSAPALSPQPPL